MTPTEVLKMLKGKIDASGLNKCNYAIETSDIEAINQALLLYDVSGSLRDKFASDALNGLMLRHNEPGYTDRDAVNEAYKIADMMMERREQ